MAVVLLDCKLGLAQPAKVFEEKINTDPTVPGTD